MADPPRERANGGVVCRGRVGNEFGQGMTQGHANDNRHIRADRVNSPFNPFLHLYTYVFGFVKVK